MIWRGWPPRWGVPSASGASDQAIRLAVRVQPNASRNEVVGFQGDLLRVRVTAAAKEGRANKALVELLSDWLGVPRGAVNIARGYTSRDKTVDVRGVSQDKLSRLASSSIGLL